MILNAIIFALSVASIKGIGEEIMWKEISLIHLAFFLVQLELAGICFGISAFIRKSGIGIGLGIATVMYFLNIVANISESAEFLKYITPFGYAESADGCRNCLSTVWTGSAVPLRISPGFGNCWSTTV